MKIFFSLDGIKNMDQLYTWTMEYNEALGREIRVECYHGAEYCGSIVAQLTGWKEKSYSGSHERIANETFVLISSNGCKYVIGFKINTYEEKMARLEVTIMAPDTDTYDHLLEDLKIELKTKLIPDWRVCTWLVDEQAAKLCKEAYERAFSIENNLRAFASKVLIHYLGDCWLQRPGLEKQCESVRELAMKFTQRVSDFDDINTDFLSMTLETLTGIVFKGVVYKDTVTFNRQEYDEVVGLCKNAKSSANILGFLKKHRPVEKNIWCDIFAPFFPDPDAFKSAVHVFIEDRNHVAHSKILSWMAYQVIEKDFQNVDALLLKANSEFEQKEASEELLRTWDAMEKEEPGEDYVKEYYRERLAAETGIDILDEGGIEDWFDEVLHDLYSDVYQRYHLDVGFEISDFESPSTGEKTFAVSCPVDEKLVISVTTEYSIDDDLGDDSTCCITATNFEGQTICKAEIRFHNGNGFENEDGLMEADDNTEYDTSELEEFVDELFAAIDGLNPYPAELDSLEYKYKGARHFVADFPCEQCGKFMISVNEEFLPVGICGYCGCEHVLEPCIKCGKLTEDLDHGLCASCATYIDEQ